MDGGKDHEHKMLWKLTTPMCNGLFQEIKCALM